MLNIQNIWRGTLALNVIILATTMISLLGEKLLYNQDVLEAVSQKNYKTGPMKH
jgi:hypothetical protein